MLADRVAIALARPLASVTAAEREERREPFRRIHESRKGRCDGSARRRLRPRPDRQTGTRNALARCICWLFSVTRPCLLPQLLPTTVGNAEDRIAVHVACEPILDRPHVDRWRRQCRCFWLHHIHDADSHARRRRVHRTHRGQEWNQQRGLPRRRHFGFRLVRPIPRGDGVFWLVRSPSIPHIRSNSAASRDSCGTRHTTYVAAGLPSAASSQVRPCHTIRSIARFNLPVTAPGCDRSIRGSGVWSSVMVLRQSGRHSEAVGDSEAVPRAGSTARRRNTRRQAARAAA
jgi:hypothetical protein